MSNGDRLNGATHLDDRHGERVDVALERLGSVVQEFRSLPPKRPSTSHCRRCTYLLHARKAKIAQKSMLIIRDEDVATLEIAVYYAMGVQIFEGQGDFVNLRGLNQKWA